MIYSRFEGGKELERALNALPHVTARASVRRVLKKAGQPIAERGARNAPRAQGDLAASYNVSTRLTKRQRRMSRRVDPVEVYIGPNDPGGVQTEFGNDHQPATPHLRPAWQALKRQTLKAIANELAKDIERTVARRRGK